MATVAHPIVEAFVLKTATCTFKLADSLDTDDFTPQIHAVKITPTVQSGSWAGIGGNTTSEQGMATWAASFGAIQDLDAESFQRWLFDNEGKKALVTATLKSGSDALTFTVTLAPGEIGGEVGPNPLTFTVPMPCDAKPVWS